MLLLGGDPGGVSCCSGAMIEMGPLSPPQGQSCPSYTGIAIEHLRLITQGSYGGIDNECAGLASYVNDVKISAPDGYRRGAPSNWGAAFRNSSVSASESSSITTGSARPSWLMTSAGNQQGSATPKSRGAVTMTDMPGTLAASRRRSMTVRRSSSS